MEASMHIHKRRWSVSDTAPVLEVEAKRIHHEMQGEDNVWVSFKRIEAGKTDEMTIFVDSVEALEALQKQLKTAITKLKEEAIAK